MEYVHININTSLIFYSSSAYITLCNSSDFSDVTSPNILMLSSPPAVANKPFFLFQSTSYTHLVWYPLIVQTHFHMGSFFMPVVLLRLPWSPSGFSGEYSFHILMVLSSPHVANRLPKFSKLIDQTVESWEASVAKHAQSSSPSSLYSFIRLS